MGTEKQMKSKLLAIGILLLIVGTGIIPAIAQDTGRPLQISRGDWLYVGGNGPGNYTKIQDAIDKATDNDTIFVYSGLYNETINISKSIALIGQDRKTTIIQGANGTEIIRVRDCSVELTGFTIQKYNETNFVGIEMADCWSCHIHDNYVTSCDIGMLIAATHSTSISNNTFYKCGNGIWIAIFANITITHNIIEGNTEGWGIYFQVVMFGLQYKNYITRNSIMNNSLGLGLFGAWSVVIQENNFIGNHQHAFFISSFFNKWNRNYWNQSSLVPKIILGSLGGMFINIKIPLVNFDWHPAQDPYEITRIR